MRQKNKRDAIEELTLRRAQRKKALNLRRRIALGRTAQYSLGEDDGAPSSPLAGRMKVERSKAGRGDGSFANMGNVTDLPLSLPLEKKSAEVEFSDSDESEADVGILSNWQAKQRKKMLASGEATESEVIFMAVQSTLEKLARRTDVVKMVVLNEMREVKMICSAAADVVEILGRRATDLAKQQQTFIDRLGYA